MVNPKNNQAIKSDGVKKNPLKSERIGYFWFNSSELRKDKGTHIYTFCIIPFLDLNPQSV